MNRNSPDGQPVRPPRAQLRAGSVRPATPGSPGSQRQGVIARESTPGSHRQGVSARESTRTRRPVDDGSAPGHPGPQVCIGTHVTGRLPEGAGQGAGPRHQAGGDGRRAVIAPRIFWNRPHFPEPTALSGTEFSGTGFSAADRAARWPRPSARQSSGHAGSSWRRSSPTCHTASSVTPCFTFSGRAGVRRKLAGSWAGARSCSRTALAAKRWQGSRDQPRASRSGRRRRAIPAPASSSIVVIRQV